MVQNEILAGIPSDELAVYVVWTPVLDGDDRLSAVASTKNIHDSRAKHFWDPDQSLGKSFGQSMTLPEDRDLAWDIYLVFDRGVEWNDGLPDPTEWMHQLGPGERHLDGKKMRDVVEAQLDRQ